MATKIIFICDKCGSEYDDESKISTINIVDCRAAFLRLDLSKGKIFHICKPCLDGFGLVKKDK